MIRNQSRQINGLVNQVILFVSTQDLKGRYELEPLAVSDVVDAAVDRHSGTDSHKRDSPWSSTCSPDLPKMLGDLSGTFAMSAEPDYQCSQVWRPGPLDRNSRHCRRRAGPSRKFASACRTAGRALTARNCTQIFEPFYRSQAAVAGQIHGTGLGLPIAKSLAEAMGGRISVTSEVGVGSTFTLHLPVAGQLSDAVKTLGRTIAQS